MGQRIFEAPPQMQREIKCFWALDEAQEVYNDNLIVPDSYKEIIIHCGAPILRETGAGSLTELPRAYLCNLQTQPHRFRTLGASQVIAVRLYPWALPALMNSAQASDPAQEIVTLDPCWQAFAATLAGVVERKGYEEAVAQLQQYVSDRYRALSGDAAVMRAAGELIYSGSGRLDTQDAEARGFFSLSQFERLFKSLTGVTPKTYGRLVRFEAICDALTQNPAASLTGLAHQFDYSDQSHFIRDFKALAGRTPGQMALYTQAYLQRWHPADFLQAR